VTLIGIAGLGSIGSRHARVFSGFNSVRLVGFDPDRDVGEIRAALGHRASVAPSFQALLEMDLDGLVIASPDPSHRTQAVAACEAGIPLLIEKPLAGNPEDALAISQVVIETGARVLVGYVLRFFRCMRLVATLLNEGRIGEILSFQVMLGSYETLVAARQRFMFADEGILFFDYSHEWDYLRWLIGPITGAFARARTAGQLAHRQVPNVVDAVLEISGRVTGTVHLDYVQNPGTRRLTLVGDGGTLSCDVPRGAVYWTSRDASRPQEQLFSGDRDEAFRAQASHFLEVITGTAAPAVTVEDALAAVLVAESLLRSSEGGRWETVRRER
jgi:predicted dehydrogenase